LIASQIKSCGVLAIGHLGSHIIMQLAAAKVRKSEESTSEILQIVSHPTVEREQIEARRGKYSWEKPITNVN
jgi:hypothetical protein